MTVMELFHSGSLIAGYDARGIDEDLLALQGRTAFLAQAQAGRARWHTLHDTFHVDSLSRRDSAGWLHHPDVNRRAALRPDLDQMAANHPLDLAVAEIHPLACHRRGIRSGRHQLTGLGDLRAAAAAGLAGA